MTMWHAIKQIQDQWGVDGREPIQVSVGATGGPVASLRRPREA